MADAPLPTPAAAPVAPAAPPPASNNPPPPPQSRQPAAAAPPEIDFDTPIEYDDGQGGYKRATYGELIQAHERVGKMGNVDQMTDLVAAMNNDPEATERVLRRQLADIDAAKAKNSPAGNSEVSALRAELDQIKAQIGQASRVTQTIENQQNESVLVDLLSRSGVREKLPFLAAKPKNGARVALNFVQNAKRQVESSGGTFTNQHLVHALTQAEQYHRGTLEPYGIDPAKLMMPAANPNAAVSAVNNGSNPTGQVVREPLDTADSLLRSRMPVPQYGQPAPVGNNFPEPGGALGGVPAGGQPGGANVRYNHDAFVQNLKARRAANGGGA